MKNIYIGIFLIGAFFVSACSDSTEPELPISNAVQFHGNSYDYDQIDVDVDIVVRDPEGFSLIVHLHGTDGGLVSFKAQDPGSDPSHLLTKGEHGVSEQSSNSINSNLADEQIGFHGLRGDQLSIVWESIAVGEQTYSGSGYIHLKKRINYACVDSVHTANGTFGPGSDVYDRYYDANCAPGYYFPEQKIRFVCEESIIWWNLAN